MANVAVTDAADCLRALGRHDEAATAYEEVIAAAERRGDRRMVAVDKMQLATVRLLQRRYADALKLYSELLTHLLHHAGGSVPFSIGYNFENGLVTRFLSTRADLEIDSTWA
jgi:tetratricopeptide (TPR) repeat protein